MRKIFLLMAILVFSASAAYAQTDGAVSADGSIISDQHAVEVTESYVVFGEPMPDVMEKLRLSEAVQRFDELRGVEMQITGTAQACAGKDCWVVLQDGGETAKVILLDDRLTIPMDVNGQEITVFGMLEEHFEGNPGEMQDGGEEGPKDLHVIARSVRVSR